MSTPLRPTTVAGVTATRNGEMWVLIPPAVESEVLVVNETGYLIFQRCDGAHSRADIAHHIAGDSDVAAEDVANEVAAFVNRLGSAGLLAE
ncbi:PqqD family protein [Nocardia gipuzkoensis]